MLNNFAEHLSKKFNIRKYKLNSVKSIRQIYALPTRFGIYLGFALIGGVALSSRLENNFLLLMLLFQMAVFFLSIIWSANNLGEGEGGRSGKRGSEYLAGRSSYTKRIHLSARPPPL